MLPTREGLFNAYPVELGIDETGPNKLATCVINFKLYEELQQSGEWEDCAAENFHITGYFYLEKKDGSLNTVTIDSLKNALGWDGRDPFWLQETDLSEHPVQVKLTFEEYNGKTRIKVQYLNPYGSSGVGGVTKADGETRRSISNRLGSKLRAVSGPAKAPAKSAAPPKLPPAKPKAKPAEVPPEQPKAGECTKQEAWEAFCAAYEKLGPKGKVEDCEQQWFAILADLFPGKQPDELSPTDWAKMRDQGGAQIIPF